MRALAPLLVAASLSLAAEEPVTWTDLLRTQTTWDGGGLRFPRSGQPELQALIMEMAPGARTGWHKHPVGLFGYVLEGTFRVQREDGLSQTFNAGEAYAQTVDTWHRGINVGRDTVRILTFIAGEVGEPDTLQRQESGPASLLRPAGKL